MSLRDRISRIFRSVPAVQDERPTMSAAVELPPPEEPKVKKGQATIPSFLTNAKPPEGALPRLDRRLATTDIESFKSGPNTYQVIRDFVAASPDLSAAVFAYTRAAITSRYVAVAKNRDGTFNRDATSLVQQLLARFDVLGDYKDGFSGIGSMRSTSEQLSKELMLTGACALELVLDKARLPRELAPVAVATLQFKSDGKELLPIQVIGSDEIDLDIPTFFYTTLDQDLREPYSASPLEPAIQPVLFATEFMNDLRRVMKKAIHPRVEVKIDWEKFQKQMPSDVQYDIEKRDAYLASFVSGLEQKINTLRPEDAVVYFDIMGIQYMTNGNISLKDEYKVLQEISDSKVATGAKAMPSILGHGSGSQNVSSTEAMLFMISAAGAIQHKLNEIYSRALTLAVRLFGQDVIVEFRYEALDLRPESELEAFKVMKQSRVLEQLSYGFITDEEASLQITGALPPTGMPKLSGTMFMSKSAADPNANPTSNTSQGQGGARNQALNPDTPKQPKTK